MNCHGHLCAGLDRRHLVGSKRILSVLSDVDVSSQLCSPTLVNDVRLDLGVTNDRGILLARADACAVSCNGIID